MANKKVLVYRTSEDVKNIDFLLELIPKYCKCLSFCGFKQALVLLNPSLGSKPTLSVLDNVRSPFIVLALAESMYVEFNFIEIEIKRPQESISHMYAQSLVDLEMFRQYLVLQIRNVSLRGRRKSSKLV